VLELSDIVLVHVSHIYYGGLSKTQILTKCKETIDLLRRV